MHQNQINDDKQFKVFAIIILVALLGMFLLGYKIGVITS